MRVFVVAGEASGDLHAANLLRELQGQTEVEAFGVGGEQLRAAGLECVARSEELSIMGLAEVVHELPRLLGLARRVRREAVARRPAVAVLVDSPDFNLPLARKLHRAGVPVIIYVSPQLWAWRSGRVRRIRRDARRVLCILPFEIPFYEEHGVAAEYVGHPLVDELGPVMAEAGQPEGATLALLPGSRWQEIDALLPTMALAADRLGAGSRLRVKVVVAPGIDPNRVASLLGAGCSRFELVVTDRHRELASCAVAMVASGTATLECALLGVPMVVAYRLHALTYWLARLVVRVPHVSLVNLTAGREVVPELVQGELTVDALAARAQDLMGPDGERQRRELREVRERLGPPGASERAARAVLALSREATSEGSL